MTVRETIICEECGNEFTSDEDECFVCPRCKELDDFFVDDGFDSMEEGGR